MASATVSKHLRLLRRARLVEERRRGRLRVYRLTPNPLKAVDSWLGRYRAFWQMRLTNLKDFVESEHLRDRLREGGRAFFVPSFPHLPLQYGGIARCSEPTHFCYSEWLQTLRHSLRRGQSI